jgi:hypothetical protein
MPLTNTNIPVTSEGAIEAIAVNYTERLDAAELLVDNENFTIVEIPDTGTATDLTITNVAVSGIELIIEENTVAVGKAVQCYVSGQQVESDGHPKTYRLRITVTTDAGRKFVDDVLFNVE